MIPSYPEERVSHARVKVGGNKMNESSFKTADDTQPSMDKKILETLIEQAGLEFAHKLLKLFDQSVGSGLTSIAAAIPVENVDEVAAMAHRLKGSSFSIGAQRLGALMVSIESAVKSFPPQWGRVNQLLEKSQLEFVTVKGEMQSMLV